MKFLYYLFFYFLFACSPKKADLGSFEYESFKFDKGGCMDFRSTKVKSLKKQKESILGLNQQEIFATFGKFDVQVLSKRSKRVYIYYLEKGPQCDQIQNKSDALTLALEFNSVGLVQEILFQKGIPY